MKTRQMFCLIGGLILLTTSCSIIKKNKSREPFTVINKTDSLSVSKYEADKKLALAVKGRMSQVLQYALQNGYSTEYFFLVDMSIHSGKNRFFVYDFKKDTIALEGLVAHGNCNTHFLEEVRFSNAPSCGCSSLGKYKVGNSYQGEFGKSYRLYGLDSTNSNAFKRAIVLHGFGPVPDEEIYPRDLCNSFGCPMVSRSFLIKLSEIIDKSKKPILLWIYD
ncbi:MAG TPA: murein L,D-transpeptidase catalytic domain family protein [Puia sp.]|nr:murein L,D-transpeptidase catalytic domain family protein [Puia sp.]